MHLYNVVMQCLQSAPYAGLEFEAKAFQWLEDSQGMSAEEREAGWIKLHAEYEELTRPHWESVYRKINRQGELRSEAQLVQRELFA